MRSGWLYVGLTVVGSSVAVVLCTLFLPVAAAAAPFCPAVINYGETIECSLDSAGEADSYTFAGVAGDSIRLRVVGTGSLVPDPELVQPDGTAICEVPNSKVTCRLQVSGTHTIRVRGASRTGTGFYTVYLQRLNNPVGCTALAYGAPPASGSIDLGGEMDCITFTGAVDDRIRVRAQPTSGTLGPVATEVVQPNGTTVCEPATPGASADLICLLRTSGLHVIFVVEASAWTAGAPAIVPPSPYPPTRAGLGTGRYSVSLQRLNNPVGCTSLSFGGPGVEGSIDVAGEVDCYTFTGAANDRVRIVVPITADLPAATIEVLGPDGTSMGPDGTSICGPTYLVPGSSGGRSELTCRLTTSGAHTIFVANTTQGSYGYVPPPYGPPAPGSPGTGRYRLFLQRLNNPVGCTAIAFGAIPTAGVIDVPGETDCFTFTGAANDRVRARTVATSTTLSTTVEIVAPDGTPCPPGPYYPGPSVPPIYGGGTGASEVTCVLEQSGTHTLFVGLTYASYPGGSTGQYYVQIQRLNNALGCAPIAYGGGPASGSISSTAEMDCFTFAGTANSQVRIAATTTTPGLTLHVEVWQPNGTLLCQTYAYTTTYPYPTTPVPPPYGTPDLTCNLEAAGSHTILVSDASGRGSGSYELRLTCAAGGCPTVGGSGFALADGGRMTWHAGTIQTSYLILRWSFPSGTSTTLGPASGSTTAYQDQTARGSDAIFCYTLVPLGASGALGNSDVLCWMPGSTSAGSPQNFSLQLTGPTGAQLTWTAPSSGNYDGYQLAAVDVTAGQAQVLPLATGTTNTGQTTNGRLICYTLTATMAGAPVGSTSVLCGIPGSGTLN